MKFRQKALALLTVSLMILSNCFTAIPIAHASGALDWPSQEFRFQQDETELFSPFLDGKGYVGVKCDGYVGLYRDRRYAAMEPKRKYAIQIQ